MRLILTILIVTLYLLTYGQDDTLNKPITYTGVVTVDTTISKDELYRRAKRWANDEFRSLKDVTQIDDKENGELSLKGWFAAMTDFNGFPQDMGKLWFEVRIYIKNGRYKFVITNFRHEAKIVVQYQAPDFGILTYNPNPPDVYWFMVGKAGKAHAWNSLKQNSKTQSDILIKSLKTYMIKPSPTDDW